MEKELYEILTEIAYGLKSKEFKIEKMKKNEEQFNHKYIIENKLIRAINKLYAFAVKHKIYKSGVIPNDESDGIVNFFNKHISIWIKELESQLNVDLSDLYEDEPLIELYGENKYRTTETCISLAEDCDLYNKDSEQKRLFKKIRNLEQEQYEYIRKFIIKNPIIETEDKYKVIRELKELGLAEAKIEIILNLAYEAIPNDVFYYCSNCGWTVSKSLDEVRKCIDERCRIKSNNFTELKEIGDTRIKLRLRPGVMRFVALPGILELNIAKFCESYGFQYELWPNNDSYDIKIKKHNGDIVIIDAKDYRSAFTLANNLLKKESLFYGIEYNNAFIVVPDETIENRYDYCVIVNKALTKINKDVKCVTISKLFQLLGEN